MEKELLRELDRVRMVAGEEERNEYLSWLPTVPHNNAEETPGEREIGMDGVGEDEDEVMGEDE